MPTLSQTNPAGRETELPHIDYFCSTLSPYVYLAGTRPGAIAARHGATISYRPLDIMALFARTGGTAVKDRHASRTDYRAQELRRHSQKTGLTLNLHPSHWPTNGAPAAYAIIAAQAAGGDVGPLLHEICARVWARDEDIADDRVVRSCLAETGFDPDLADRGLMAGAEAYAANLEEAVTRGVFGAPFLIVADTDERFWGQDRLADLDACLDELA